MAEGREGVRTSGKIDIVYHDPGSGMEPLARDILERDLHDRSIRILSVPTSRMIAEVKRMLASGKGVIVNGLTNHDSLPGYLYDLLGGDIPVANPSLRDMYIFELLDRRRPSSLTGGRRPGKGMVKMVSDLTGDLLKADVDPLSLKKACRSERSMDLYDIYLDYYSVLRRKDFIDPDLLHREVMSLLHSRQDLLCDLRLGVYLPNGLMQGLENVLSRLVELSSTAKVVLSPYHPPPAFLGKMEVRTHPEIEIGMSGAGSEGRGAVQAKNRFPVIRGRDRMDEVRQICRALRSMFASGEVIPEDVSLVFPQREYYLKAVQSAFPDHKIPFDMTNDMSLARSPPVAAVLKLLDCMDRGYPRGLLMGALSSPFLRLGPEKDPVDRQRLDMILRECFIFGGGGDIKGEWLEPLNEGLTEESPEEDRRVVFHLTTLLHKMEDVAKNGSSVAELNKGVISVLKELSFLECTEDNIRRGESIEDAVRGQGPYQFQGRSISELFNCMRVLDVNSRMKGGGDIELGSYLLLLRSVIDKVSLRSTPRREGIEIMGLREFEGLRRKTVIFGGMVQGDIPSYHRGFSILSDDERNSLGLRELNDTRPQLESLCLALSCAERPIMSLHERRGEGTASPSSFICGLIGDDIEIPDTIFSDRELYMAIGEATSMDHLHPKRSGQRPPLEPLLSHVGSRHERIRRGYLERLRRSTGFSAGEIGSIKDDALLEVLNERFGKDHVWSPSRLDSFRECPYRFFIENILSIKELRGLEPEVPADKRGSIFHTIVERFFKGWTEAEKERVNENNLKEASNFMVDTADAVLSGYSARGPYWEALRDHLAGSDGEEGILQDLLRVEASYGGPFTVERTEFRFGMGDDGSGIEVGTVLQDGRQDPLKIRGVVDRIDSAEIGNRRALFLWDYKTGRSPPSKDSLQVPLYIAAMRSLERDNDTVGGGYILANRRGAVVRHPVLGGAALEDPEKIERTLEGLNMVISDNMAIVMEYIDKIRSGRFHLPERCKSSYCNFSDICRRRE